MYVPRPGVTPLGPPPEIPLTEEIVTNRQLTHAFIMMDPTEIALVPVERVEAPSGGFTTEDLPPRPVQTFKLINQAGDASAITPGEGARARKYDFVLVGEWDATVRIDDFWEDPNAEDSFWVVTDLVPYNGYEVKARLTQSGDYPLHG